MARVASSNRVGRLKGYGNAINAQAAAAFIRAYMGSHDARRKENALRSIARRANDEVKANGKTGHLPL